ncbi:DUF3726 domain-containing protein [Roseibacterium sp. SDUM158017]|uniref:DUF3726 domain-containing protein n=1 Tax=Roseicyclus salinarum TaxID=3036773 RepID=UPI002414E829|nr:DUF3726 domain-containing protein [Roseibacterium sp. SDUM158017]MDG4647288.1 DUF3726 domain-containing protein [Roseibacterium sp. SDUM158017]
MVRPPSTDGASGPALRAAPADPLLSRSEIEALCAKAARGAGMAWGLAEEAGFAAGWLSARGIDGPRALADHLHWAQGLPWHEICPAVARGMWTARGDGMLCPVALGATLSDFCTLPEAALDDEGLTLGPVSRPVILLPFLAAVARRLGHPVEVSWAGGRIAISPAGGMSGALCAIGAVDCALLTLCRGADAPEPAAPGARRGCSKDTLDSLGALALKTTVPPSETSRADAGAGTSDND